MCRVIFDVLLYLFEWNHVSVLLFYIINFYYCFELNDHLYRMRKGIYSYLYVCVWFDVKQSHLDSFYSAPFYYGSAILLPFFNIFVVSSVRVNFGSVTFEAIYIPTQIIANVIRISSRNGTFLPFFVLLNHTVRFAFHSFHLLRKWTDYWNNFHQFQVYKNLTASTEI